MDAETYFAELQWLCAFHGFLACPLTREQSGALHAAGYTLDVAYAVACDVHAGFTFELPESRS